jgi:formate dehydrogenase iron-sulfur subunit
MDPRRREFLKLAAAAAAALTTGGLTASGVLAARSADSSQAGAAPPVPAGDQSLGVLVDPTICIRCRKCEWACNRQHHLSDRSQAEYEDKSVLASERRPVHDAFTVVNQLANPANSEKPYGIKVQCMHCLRPACASACLVGALRKDPRGPVYYDEWRCIGCRYCMVACPFEIPAYEYHRALEPRVRKCTFCYERVLQQGLPPACVEICPNEALTFGPRERLIDIAYVRLKATPERYVHRIYGEHEAGGTSWLYLLPVPAESAGLPALGETPIPETTEHIQHAIFKGFVPPLALYGLLGLIMHSTRRNGATGPDATGDGAADHGASAAGEDADAR